MRIEEINQRIEKVMKTDATFAREADFMLTHVPFKKLYDFIPESGKVDFDGGKAHYYINPEDYADKESFSEDVLLERFIRKSDSQEFLLVQGNSGTGKSNLIRWVYYMYKKALVEADDDSEQIIFIQRSYNSLKDAIKRILDYKILPEDRTRYYLDKIGGGGQEATGDELAATVYAMLQVVINFDKDYEQFLDEDVYNGLKILLEDRNVKKYVFMKENGPIARICQRISGNRITGEKDASTANSEVGIIYDEKDFTFKPMEIMKVLSSDGHKASKDVMDSFQMIFGNPLIRRLVVSYLNSMNEKVIARSSTLDATDVKGIFREIRKELKAEEKNLTLFIEDINAYTGMDKALIEILIDDEEDDDSKKEMCRLKSMVGSTDNFYDLLHTSLKARITESIVVLDESVLSDENKLLEFAARYINAVNLTEEQVNEWYYNGKEVPVSEIKNQVTTVDLDGSKYSIFPFTREAIINLFNCLDANYRTPRGLLKYVIKHTLSNWNTMEDRIFEVSTSFINIGIRSLSALTLPREVQNSIMEMSPKEQQYIQLWGYDYRNNRIVNNSDIERELFKINVAEEIVIPKVGITPILSPIKGNAPDSKMDRALRHIDEWEKNINPKFVIHKDMRDWIGKYILGQINWQLEGILYSKASEVCGSKSFIEIEGHESRGSAELYIERTAENANFMKALVYWNYEGEKKSWNFSGGMEEKIIAKVWLEKHKAEILSALKRYTGRVEQTLPEYVVRAKVYSALMQGRITSLTLPSVVKALIVQDDLISTNNKNSEWKSLVAKIKKYDESINSLFREYFYRAVGSSDVVNTTYTFIDVAYLNSILENIIEDIKAGEDKLVSKFGNKDLEAPIEVINIYHQYKLQAFNEVEKALNNAIPIYADAFTRNVTTEIIKSTVVKMQQYLSYVNIGLNHVTEANLISVMEKVDTPDCLYQEIQKVYAYKLEDGAGEKLVKLAMLNDSLIQNTAKELKAFIEFMNVINKKFTSNINENIEKEIINRKEDIKNVVSTCIKAGGAE